LSPKQDTQKSEQIPVSFNVKVAGDKVVIVFDKDISWVGLTPQQALLIAEQLKVASVTLLRSKVNSAE
jgi:hypothetical protein